MTLVGALKYLFPNADTLRDYTIQDNSDGVGPYIAAWHLADPQPTPAELQTASDAYDAQQAQASADAAALRTRIVNLAQSSVGIAVDQLTAAQVRALFAIILWKAGALNRDGIVQPLNTWI